MNAFVYDAAVNDIISGALKLGVDTLKVMLVNSTYVASKSDTFVDMSLSTDAKHGEIVCTSYVPGWGSASRMPVVPTVSLDVPNNRVKSVFGVLTWSALGGAVNDTIVAAVLIKEGSSNDQGSRLVAYWPLSAPYLTNGLGFQLSFDGTNGNLNFNC